MIETRANRDFGNLFLHHNGPTQRQHTHKSTIQQHQKKLVSSINAYPIKHPGPHQ